MRGVGDERGRVRRRLRPAVQVIAHPAAAFLGGVDPAQVQQPVDLVLEQQQGRDGRCVEGLVFGRVRGRDIQVQRLRDPTARGGDPSCAFQRGRGAERHPQTPVRGEVLLRGEVVDIRA